MRAFFLLSAFFWQFQLVAQQPVPEFLLHDEIPQIVFDTDMGYDVDDALALGVLHSLKARGECEVLGVSTSKNHPDSARYIEMVHAFYGHQDVPVGKRYVESVFKNPPKPWPGEVLSREEVAGFYQQETEKFETSLSLLRRSLASAVDKSVVLIAVGPCTMMAELLQSPADDHSALSGKDLIMAKVRYLSVMGGDFDGKSKLYHEGAEANIYNDIPAAQAVFSKWPTPIILSPWKVGAAVRYPWSALGQDFHWTKFHPVAEAYRVWRDGKPFDRPTWDLSNILHAVRPEAKYFSLSGPVSTEVSDKGITTKQSGSGNVYILGVQDEAAALRLEEVYRGLVSQPVK